MNVRDWNIKILLLIPVIFITTISFGQNAAGFEISGNVPGLPDRVWVYLSEATDPAAPVYLDSVQVAGSQFKFKGTTGHEFPVWVMISTKNYEDYKYFWLENSMISFALNRPGLTNAVVTGSHTQEDQDALHTLMNTYGSGQEKMIAFVRSHPNSIVSSRLLSIYGATWGRDTSAVLFDGLSTAVKNSIYGRTASAFIQGE